MVIVCAVSYTFTALLTGNLETYMVSYMKHQDTYTERYSSDIQWVLGLFFVAKVMGMLAAGWLHDGVGARTCTMTGCALSRYYMRDLAALSTDSTLFTTTTIINCFQFNPSKRYNFNVRL